MDTAVFYPLQIYIPGILKYHTWNGKHMGFQPAQKNIQIQRRIRIHGLQGKQRCHRGLFRFRFRFRLSVAFLVDAIFVFILLYQRRTPLLGNKINGFACPPVTVFNRCGWVMTGQGFQRPIGHKHKIAMKRAQGILSTRGLEIGGIYACLGLHCLYHLGQGDSLSVSGGIWKSSKITDGLKMDPPHMGGPCQAKTDDMTHLVMVYSRYQGGDQHHGKVLGTAIGNGLLFDGLEGSSPEGPMDRIIHSVKLQKNAVKPCLFQIFDKGFILCKAKAIGVELDKTEPHLLAHGNDLGQIIPYSGFSSGKLDIAAAAGILPDFPIPLSYPVKSRIGNGASSVGKTDRTVKVASPGNLQQSRAGTLPVLGTDTAVKGASPLHPGAVPCWSGRGFGPDPAFHIREALPDQGTYLSMFRTRLNQKNTLFFLYAPGLNLFQTMRAEAPGMGQHPLLIRHHRIQASLPAFVSKAQPRPVYCQMSSSFGNSGSMPFSTSSCITLS